MKINLSIWKVESEEKMFIQTNKIENDNKEENKKEIDKEKIEKNEKNEKIERIVDPPAKITKKKKGMIKGLNYIHGVKTFSSLLLIEIKFILLNIMLLSLI